jgi:transcriptional regulator with XRE-family HTH domain
MEHGGGTKVSLGTFIRRRRTELGLTQEELAARVGDSVRQSDISRLERDGVSLPRRNRLEHIAKALDVSLGTLMRQTGWLDDDVIAEGQEVVRSVGLSQSPEPPAFVASPDIPPIHHHESPGPAASRYDADEIEDGASALNSALTRAAEVRRQTEAALRQSSITIERARRLRSQR